MSELTDFLLARIAEDELIAREAGPMPWIYATNEESVLDFEAHRVTPLRTERANNAHVYRWNPGRALAECEAKRRWIEHVLHESESRLTDEQRFSLRAMALPYAHHRGYREEWRP